MTVEQVQPVIGFELTVAKPILPEDGLNSGFLKEKDLQVLQTSLERGVELRVLLTMVIGNK